MTLRALKHPEGQAARLPATMRALVYKGRHRLAWEERPAPRVEEATDAVVRVAATTLCRTDLRILEGRVATAEPGRVLGHEAVGVVEATGAAVRLYAPGDRVVVSAITSCGVCDRCAARMTSHCRIGGWLLGRRLDGTQAELLRVPCADGSLHRLPSGVDEEAGALFSDLMPTAYECGVRRPALGPGERLAVVGAGPVGLAVVMTASLHGPVETLAVDIDEYRLSAARELGAAKCVEDAAGGGAAETVRALTGGDGVDVAAETAGRPEAFALCADVLAPGGRLAVVGAHSGPVSLPLERLGERNVTVSTQLVDGTSTAMLLSLAARGRLDASRLITHRFTFGELEKAYEVFSRAGEERALKVVVRA